MYKRKLRCWLIIGVLGVVGGCSSPVLKKGRSKPLILENDRNLLKEPPSLAPSIGLEFPLGDFFQEECP